MAALSTFHYTPGLVFRKTIHSAITATVAEASVKPELCAGAKAISIVITEGGTVNNRSGAFTFYVSNDGVTFVAYNMVIDNVTNTNGQNLTRIASKTRNAAGSDVLFFDPATLGGITYFKVVPTITDGGAPTGNFTVEANIAY